MNSLTFPLQILKTVNRKQFDKNAYAYALMRISKEIPLTKYTQFYFILIFLKAIFKIILFVLSKLFFGFDSNFINSIVALINFSFKFVSAISF